MKLVCVPCGLELRPEQNGFVATEMASFGPYKLWHSDKYRCPGCGLEVLGGFPLEAIAEHFQPDFSQLSERSELLFYGSMEEKAGAR